MNEKKKNTKKTTYSTKPRPFSKKLFYVRSHFISKPIFSNIFVFVQDFQTLCIYVWYGSLCFTFTVPVNKILLTDDPDFYCLVLLILYSPIRTLIFYLVCVLFIKVYSPSRQLKLNASYDWLSINPARRLLFAPSELP